MKELYPIMLASFSGAFFAFIFLRLSEFYTKINERKKLGHNALVLLQRELNDTLSLISSDLYIIPPFRKNLSEGNLYTDNLHTIILLDKIHLENLHDIDLINKLFSFNVSLRSLNSDIETTKRAYTQIREAFTAGRMEKDYFFANSKFISDRLEEIEKYMTHLLERNIGLSSIVRIKTRLDMPKNIKTQLDAMGKPKPIPKRVLEKEKKTIKREIEQQIEKSTKEKEKIFNE